MRPVFVLLLSTLPLLGQMQDPSAPWASTKTAAIDVSPQTNGDVSLSISNSTLGPGAVALLARTLLRCQWEPYDTGENDARYVTGDCRKWLRADATYMEGTLDLAPLVLGLRASGSREVRLKLWTAALNEVTPPKGWKKQSYGSKTLLHPVREYYVYAATGADLPPAFPVTAGERWNPSRLTAPLLFLVVGPPLLALWLRRRAQRQGSLTSSAVWLNWILNGAFLYWMSAVRPTDITGFLYSLHLQDVVKLLLGVALYAAPPLLAMASCLSILGPGGSEGRESRGRLLRIALLAQAAFILPLGVFLAGVSMLGRESAFSVVCIPGAYVLYRVINWYNARLRFGGLQNLASGELTERAAAIAQAAGAKLHGVYILRNRLAREVNAFATGTGVIILTQGMVERMPRRELDAVIAHEAGHLGGRHNSIRSTLFWVYVILAQPLMQLLITGTGLPPWLALAPLGPLVYVFAVAWISQRHEFDADARAVQITGDPEAAIAALARLSRITQSPVDWGGIQGSLLSHPSMKQRVLSIARRFAVPEARALEILADPNTLAPANAGEVPALPTAYVLPEEFHQADPVFNSGAMQAYIFWVSWALNVVLVGVLVSLAIVIGHVMWRGGALLFLACTPAVAWAYLRVANLCDRLFRKQLRRRIAARAPHPQGAIFVGLLPGASVRPLEGFYEWDMGFLSLMPGSLTYRGERARFTLARHAVTAVTVQAGPISWDRTWGVVVTHQGGAFVLRRPDAGYTWRKARQFETRLNAWRQGEPAADPPPQPGELLAPPDLPQLTPYAPMRAKLAAAHVKRAGMLFLGAMLLCGTAERLVATHPMVALAPLAAPLSYLLAVVPTWLRRERA